MYSVRIECSGEVLEIMETDQMTSSGVYKSVLADVKWHAFKEHGRGCAGRYEAYVYKNGACRYLIALSIRHSISHYWLGVTRESDLKTCVIKEG